MHIPEPNFVADQNHSRKKVLTGELYFLETGLQKGHDDKDGLNKNREELWLHDLVSGKVG